MFFIVKGYLKILILILFLKNILKNKQKLYSYLSLYGKNYKLQLKLKISKSKKVGLQESQKI